MSWGLLLLRLLFLTFKLLSSLFCKSSLFDLSERLMFLLWSFLDEVDMVIHHIRLYLSTFTVDSDTILALWFAGTLLIFANFI